MSLDACITGLLDKGEMTEEQAERARAVYGASKARHRANMGEAAAEAVATQETLDALTYQAKQRKRQILLQADAQGRALRDMAKYQGDNPGGAALALFDHDQKAPYADGNVAVTKQTIVGRAHAMMEGILNTFSRNIAGQMRNKAEMADVLRELFGQHSGNESAKELAEAWTQTAEMLRMRFNQAGGAIDKLTHWGLPQAHDGVRIRDAGFSEWRDFIADRLDPARMIDSDTGQPFTPEGLETALRNVYETITTDGWAGREPGGQFGKGKLANTRAEHRFLHFRDADAWGEYHDRFGGGGSAFDVMIGHVDDMARDIAHMERLGPNPAATVKWLQDGVLKDAALRGDRGGLFSSPAGDARAIGRLYDVTSGRMGIPVNAKWARGLGAVRSLITSAKLGGAVFSAISDTGFQIVTRGFNGLPVWGAVTDHLKLLASEGDRQGAIRLGLIAEEAGRQAAGINRYMGESVTPGITARLADATLRISGLSAWTQTGKWAYGMGELARATGLADRRFEQLPDDYAQHLQRYGIDAAGWDGIRQASRLKVRGADFIDPTAIADRALGDRVLRMILTETAYAVPEVTARSRAMTMFDRPGTLAGEFGRNALQFKSFGVSMLLTHGRRIAGLQPYNMAKYGGQLILTTMMLGAVALQAKEIAKGRDPKPMDDWHFWRDAVLQGSGFGVIGDLLQSQVIQKLSQGSGMARVQGLGEYLGGPVVSLLDDAVKLGISPFEKSKSDPTYGRHVGHEVIRDIKGYTPFVSTWYARAAIERLLIDQLQTQIDPNYRKSWNMMEKHASQQGQEYWWAPGEQAPARAPDFQGATTSPPAH